MSNNLCNLKFEPAYQNEDLLCESIKALITNNYNNTNFQLIEVAQINPKYAGGNELCSHYNIPTQHGANCIIIEATRSQTKQFAACVYPVNARVDLNKIVRKALNARRVSMAPVDEVIEKSGMEYGSITPLGLPESWPVLIDSSILLQNLIIIGSGKINSKLRLPVTTLVDLSSAMVIENLAK